MLWSGYVEAAKKDKKLRFTALFHYIYDRTCSTGPTSSEKAAAGVDGETWQHYGEDLLANLQDLSHRLQRGAYQAKPVRRVYASSVASTRPTGFRTNGSWSSSAIGSGTDASCGSSRNG